MKLLLLCAGYATRLYPLTKDKPKPLLPVADMPIIEYVLKDCAAIDEIDAVYIVTNDKFSSHFEEWGKGFSYNKPITIINDKTVSNDDRLGAIGDIMYTINQMKIDDDLLVVGGDNIFDLDMKAYLAFARAHAPHACIAAYDVKDRALASQYGIVAVDKADVVTDFAEKPQDPPSTLASLALYYFPKAALGKFQTYLDEGNNPDQPGKYIAWLVKKDAVFCYSFDGSWFDIGDFDSLENANAHYRS